MKTIILVRHGKAEEEEENGSDFERRLIKRGIFLSEFSAKKLASKKIMPDMYITSPAPRALETADIFAQILGFPSDQIVKNEQLYFDFSPESFIRLLHGIDNKVEILALFGHNPFFTDIAGYFSGDFNSTMPKSSVVVLKFNCLAWNKIKKKSGELLFYIKPKEWV